MKYIGYFSLLLIFIFLVGGLIGYYFLYQTAVNYINADLQEFSKEVLSDLQYDNGRWDTSLYDADPNTPHPNGSSGFSNPLYIITIDGFVIERNRPLSGLLDSSDFKRLIGFKSPQTLKTATNESWRVLSQPIQNQGKTIGVIFTSIYNPIESDQLSTDSKLAKNIQYINSKILIKNDLLESKQVDVRNIDYDVSFEVVSQYNKVLASNGRVPTFIDPSYVYDQLKGQNTTREFIDSQSQKPFLILTTPVLDKDKNVVGVIVEGNSIESINGWLLNYIFFFVVFSIITISGSLIFIYLSRSKLTVYDVNQTPPKVNFDKKKGILKVGRKTITIPYASNQYYLCVAIFSNPRKRWEQDILLKRFGEDDNFKGWRKIYDAALAINKKAGFKIVENKEKVFQLNPELWSFLD